MLTQLICCVLWMATCAVCTCVCVCVCVCVNCVLFVWISSYHGGVAPKEQPVEVNEWVCGREREREERERDEEGAATRNTRCVTQKTCTQ